MSLNNKNYLTLDNCMILTVNKNYDFIPDGRIVICDDTIEQVGEKDSVSPVGTVIDMQGRLIMPGLINTHTHSPSVLFRGLADDKFLYEWLTEHMWPAEKHLNAERTYLGSRLGYLEYLLNGMTTNVDMWYFGESISKAADESGLRAVIAPGIFAWASPESDDSLKACADYLERFFSQPEDVLQKTRVIPCVGPHDIYSTTPELLEECVALSKKYDTMIHMHISETQRDNDDAMKRFHMTPTEVAEKAGIFTRPALFAHCIFLTEGDMEIFHKYDASVSFNPVTNLKLCEGILPIPMLNEKKVNVTVGVDGAQSNNSLNLLSDIKTGVIMEKLAAENPCSITAIDAIRMITINGAKAIGMEDKIGSLEPGKLADLISIDLNVPAMTPILRKTAENLSSHVIYADRQINDVMVGGEFLLRDKKCCRVNPEEIMQKAQEAANYIIEQIDKKNKETM